MSKHVSAQHSHSRSPMSRTQRARTPPALDQGKQDVTSLEDPPALRRKSTVIMGDAVEDLHELINDSGSIQPEAKLNLLRNLRRGPHTNREHRELSIAEECEVLQDEYAALLAAHGPDAPEALVARQLLASVGATPDAAA